MKFTIELNATELTNTILNGTLLALTESASNTDINAVAAAKITQHNNKKAIEEKPEVKELGNQETDIEDEPNNEPEIEKEDAEQKPSSEETERKLTIEDVRAAFMAKNSKTNVPKLKAILNKFNVKKVTDLDEKDFPEVLKELEAI